MTSNLLMHHRTGSQCPRSKYSASNGLVGFVVAALVALGIEQVASASPMTVKQLLESNPASDVLSAVISSLGKTSLSTSDLGRPVIIRRPGEPDSAPGSPEAAANPQQPAQQQSQPQQQTQPAQPMELATGNPEKSPLLSPEITCGRVPIYEKLFHRSFNDSVAGSSGNFRILHGLDAVTGEWPWIAMIKICMGGNKCGMCTGTLLNARWIITAGHCLMAQPEQYTITFALYDLLNPDKQSFDRKVDKLIQHPDYQNLENDLLLIKLSQPVEFNDYVQPACLVGESRSLLALTKEMHCFNTGYGLMDQAKRAVKLQKLSIRMRPPSACNSDTLGAVALRRGTVCVSPLEGHIGGSCRGDSGGPDVCFNPKSNQWFLVATVSYGPVTCDRAAGDNWLTVSVDLTNFRSWIINTIANG